MDKDTKDMLGKLSIIALPIMFQSLVESALGFLDTLMIGQLGQAEIAAVGVANQVFFLVQVFFFGLNSGSSIFFAQFFGAKEYRNMRKVTAFAMTTAVSASLVCALAFITFPAQIMSIFSKDPLVIEAGVSYMRIAALSLVFMGISMLLSGGFRAEGNAKTPLYITMFSLMLNAVLNYLLIFGPGPFPALGVVGGAIATLISRFVSASTLALLATKKKATFSLKDKYDFKWSKDFLLLFLITALPALVNEVLWATGATLYKLAYSKLGTEALAATNISESIGNFFFVACLGLANGSTVILGNVLGSGDREKGVRWGIKIAHTALILGACMGVLEAISAPIFVRLFNLEGSVVETATKAMLALAFIQPFETAATVLITGVLRSGGDTKDALIYETCCIYFFGVPAVFLGVYIFHLPLYGLYLMKLTEIITKGILAYMRTRNGKWARVMTAKA